MTDHDNTQNAPTDQNRELLAMVRIASTILQYTDLHDILAAITSELSQVINFDRSSIAFKSPGRNALVLRHIYKRGGQEDKYGEGREIPLDENSVIGWVALNRRAVLRRNIAADERFEEVVQEESLSCDMVVPLIARDTVIGTINVGSYSPGALNDRDLGMLVNCGNIACTAIEHAMLLQEAKDLGERYRTLQHNASDIMFLVDKSNGRLVEVNHRSCEAMGYVKKELLEMSYFELFPSEDQFQARRDFINILSNKTSSFVDRRMIGRDGNIIFVDISASLIEIKQETFIHVLAHDISQRRMLEQQIILQNRNLQTANRKLREVDQMKTDFLANISHELRTPLSIIIAYSESLGTVDMPEDKRAEFLDVIAENGQNLLQLIDDLLDLSRLEVEGAALNTSLSHVHDVVRALWTRMQRAAERKDIDIAFEPGLRIPATYIDNKRIQQALSSLLMNAIKFTDPGGSVRVRTSVCPQGVRVEVEDNGEGIPANEISGIFDTFRQIDGSTTRRWGGLGIGLAMAKHIIELHGGTIEVHSEEGAGSTFSVVIPAGRDDETSGDEQIGAETGAPETI